MNPHLVHSVTDLVKSQPWVLGAGGLMGLGGILTGLRNIPGKLWYFLQRKFILTVEVYDDDPLFNQLTLWLEQIPYAKKARFVNAKVRYEKDKTNPNLIKSEVKLIPGTGNHFFIYKNRLIWLSRTRQESKSGQTQYNQSMSLVTFGRTQKVLTDLLSQVAGSYDLSEKQQIEIYTNTSGDGSSYWSYVDEFTPRKLSTVILDEGVIERLSEDIQNFQNLASWYEEMGIPYHRGYLLHGQAGSGKTSLVMALAGHLNASVYYLNLNTIDNDSALNSLMQKIRPHSILFIEDIDATFVKRESKQEKVSFSAVLNALDGVFSKNGCIAFMTTNHKENLDPALIRPGRIDYQIEFAFPTQYQKEQIFKRFYPNEQSMATQFATALPNGLSMAQIQGFLLLYRTEPMKAICFAPSLKPEAFKKKPLVEINTDSGCNSDTIAAPTAQKQKRKRSKLVEPSAGSMGRLW